MEISVFKNQLVSDLFRDIDINIPQYRSAKFSGKLADEKYRSGIVPLKGVELDMDLFEQISADNSDSKNAELLFKSMQGMTPNLAADSRIWVALTHQQGLRYSVDRWVNNQKIVPNGSDEEIAKAVKDHFFIGGSRRSLHSRHALSGLWWLAKVVSSRDDIPLEQAIEEFPSLRQFQQDFIERPTAIKSRRVSKSTLAVIAKAMNAGDESKLIRRGVTREWLKQINLLGGTRLLSSMSDMELEELLQEELYVAINKVA